MPKSPIVERWFELYENPMKPVVLAMREVILAADPRIEEQIKWQSPTFVFQGNLASFFPRARQRASLMFHLGAKIPGTFPRLEGTGDVSRVMKLASIDEVHAAEAELTAIVRAWCKWRVAETERPPPPAPKRAPSAKVAKATPRSAKATPRSAKATPGPAKATPGPAKATPGPAKATPRSAKATPTAAEPSARAAGARARRR